MHREKTLTYLLRGAATVAPTAVFLSSFIGVPDPNHNSVNRHRWTSSSTAICEGRPAATAPYRVAIIGSGLSGSLAAMRIRQRWQDDYYLEQRRPTEEKDGGDDNDNPPPPPTLDLRVYERASYPAGRFGAIARCKSAIADLGAQVLSTVDPADFRALGGHGVSPDDLKLAHGIAVGLKEVGIIREVEDGRLCETEERMVWEGLWVHHVAMGGMSKVLGYFLSVAGVEPSFDARIDSICPGEQEGSIRLEGVQRQYTDTSGSDPIPVAISNEFDCVVVCVPAPDALAINGVVESLSEENQRILRGVRYDSRVVEAHFYHPRLRSSLSAAFCARMELNVEEEEIGLHLISLQDLKQAVPSNDESQEELPCAVVVHGIVNSRDIPPGAVDELIARLTKADKQAIAASKITVKRINWTPTSQMIMPMEAIVADPPTNPRFQHLSGRIQLASDAKNCSEEDHNNSNVFVLGDFMTQSSFLGCVASADAAARDVVASARKFSEKRLADEKL